MDLIHRPLTYTIPTANLDKIDRREEYFDLITMAALYNAIILADKSGAHYQLASFSIDERHIDTACETIYLTGGLLFTAFIEIERLLKQYKGNAFMTELEDILESCRDYKPPEVLLEMRHSRAFRLVTDERDFTLSSHRADMFPMFTVGHKGYAVATVADESETMEKLKRGYEPEVHESLESVVDYFVNEFTLGADEFIRAISKKLGLKPVEQNWPGQLPLAP